MDRRAKDKLLAQSAPRILNRAPPPARLRLLFRRVRAISFIKVIDNARNELIACLIISADSVLTGIMLVVEISQQFRYSRSIIISPSSPV